MSDQAPLAAGEPTPVAEGNTPETAPETTAPEEAAPAAAATRFRAKVKVDGEEFEVDETELVANYQRAKASMKRFEEAKKEREEALRLKAEAENLLERVKKDPKAILRDPSVGINARELAEQILMEEIEAELMDPKERKLKELETQLAALQAEREAAAKAKEQEEMSAREQTEVQRWIKVYQEEFPKALAAAGLPLNETHVLALKEALISDLERGLDTPLEALAREVKESLLSEQKAYVGSLDPETIYDLLGPDNYKKLSEFVAQKHRPAPPRTASAKQEADSAKPKTPESKEERIARMARLLAERRG